MIQLENITTGEELANAMCRAAKEKKWHTFVGAIDGKSVQVKVYDLWPQVFTINGVRHAPSVELKTQKALKAFVLDALAYHPA